MFFEFFPDFRSTRTVSLRAGERVSLRTNRQQRRARLTFPADLVTDSYGIKNAAATSHLVIHPFDVGIIKSTAPRTLVLKRGERPQRSTAERNETARL